MTNAQILIKLSEICCSVFNNPSLTLTETTTAKDVSGWDSLSHIDLIVETERGFHITFSTKDVKGLANIGDFVQLIARKVN